MRQGVIIAIALAGLAIGALFVLSRRKAAADQAAGTSDGSSSQNIGDAIRSFFDSLTSGASGGSSNDESLPSSNVDSTGTFDAQRAAVASESIATGAKVDSGFFINPFSSPFADVPIALQEESINPITKQSQRIFNASVGSFKDPANNVFAGAFRNPDSNAVSFVEVLPSGSGSVAQNVVFTGTGSHEATAPSTKNVQPLKPGDAGYDAAVAAIRAKVLQTRSDTSVKQDNTSSPSGKAPSAAASTGTVKVSNSFNSKSAGDQILKRSGAIFKA